MGKWAQRRLLELGATPVHELGLGNDDQDLLADFEAWREGLWPALSAAIKGGTEGAAEGSEAAVAFEASFRCRWLPGAVAAPTLPSSSFEWLCRAFPKQTLYECRVEANLELTNLELTNLELTNLKGGSVRHIELACNCTERGRAAGQLRYAAADDLGVCCDNGHALAERTARALGLSLNASFEMLATARGAGLAPPLPSPCTLEHALRYYADVRAPEGAICQRWDRAALLRILAGKRLEGLDAEGEDALQTEMLLEAAVLARVELLDQRSGRREVRERLAIGLGGRGEIGLHQRGLALQLRLKHRSGDRRRFRWRVTSATGSVPRRTSGLS
jgi:sulfite reductase alpha subunit-like flavoprotein